MYTVARIKSIIYTVHRKKSRIYTVPGKYLTPLLKGYISHDVPNSEIVSSSAIFADDDTTAGRATLGSPQSDTLKRHFGEPMTLKQHDGWKSGECEGRSVSDAETLDGKDELWGVLCERHLASSGFGMI